MSNYALNYINETIVAAYDTAYFKNKLATYFLNNKHPKTIVFDDLKAVSFRE